MKKIFLSLMLLFFPLMAAHAASTDQDSADIISRSLKNDAFVVATDDSSATDSLNRISGQYDLGFTSPDQTYQSEHHYKPGPFGKAAAEEAAQKNSY